MISESFIQLGTKKSEIRELFEYGIRQAAVVGKENVYDYSIGNPSVPAPAAIADIIRELLEATPRPAWLYPRRRCDGSAPRRRR